MDMILTGRMIGAREALGLGLVARVVAKEAWLDEAKRAAGEIAAKGPIAVRLAKEAVDQAFEAPLRAGIEFERRAFYLARASEDATEGLTAFVEKRARTSRAAMKALVLIAPCCARARSQRPRAPMRRRTFSPAPESSSTTPGICPARGVSPLRSRRTTSRGSRST